MARIFITGSADGLGFLSAKALVSQGHNVVLHARNDQRKREVLQKLPEAVTVLVGDLSSIDETKELARQVNGLGTFDAVIHNAGVHQVAPKTIFAVNTLAPYLLTCMISKPQRLIYLSSGMHMGGKPNLQQFSQGTSNISYSDSKLHVVMLSIAVAKKWKGVYSNAVNPGWVPTKMGGHGAPDDLQKGYETQVWLATSDEDKARVSGHYFFHKQIREHNSLADNDKTRDEFLQVCGDISGVSFPEH